MTESNEKDSLIQQAALLQRQARADGLRWYDRDPTEDDIVNWLLDEVREFREAETAEEREDELGDIMMFVVRLANFHNLDCDRAVAHAIDKFSHRIDIIHQLAQRRHGTSDLNLLNAKQVASLWRECKKPVGVAASSPGSEGNT